MDWACDKTRICDDTLLYKPGTLVTVDFEQYLPLKGDKEPRIVLDNYVYSAPRRHGHEPIGLVLQLDNLETYYQVLVEDTKYWVLVPSVKLANKN